MTAGSIPGIHCWHMKIRAIVMTLALSFTAAVYCSGAEVATPTATPAKAAKAKAAVAAKPAAAPKTAAMAKKEMPAKKETPAKMAAPMSPHMGTWKLNEAKSKLAPGTGKNMTVVYSPGVKDAIKVTVDGVDKDGKPMHSVWIGMFNGKSYVVKGDKTSDSRGYTMVNDHTLDMTVRKDGKVTATGKIVVAKNGKSRVVTLNWVGADGKKTKTKAVYDKA